MSEIHFIVEEAPEGGFVARAIGVDIFTEADDLPRLHEQVRDAVRCHFDEELRPAVIRLHITREEALAA
ncbi:MAG: 2-oxoisovalerate dehydrogenase E1 subunit beta [Burkholderiales bacterium]